MKKQLITPTVKDVLKEFDTPATLKLDALRKHNRVLENQIRKNTKQIHTLSLIANIEQESVANKLDKKIPNWRMLIVQSLHLKKCHEKQRIYRH